MAAEKTYKINKMEKEIKIYRQQRKAMHSINELEDQKKMINEEIKDRVKKLRSYYDSLDDNIDNQELLNLDEILVPSPDLQFLLDTPTRGIT